MGAQLESSADAATLQWPSKILVQNMFSTKQQTLV